jgi:hypothetical protein
VGTTQKEIFSNRVWSAEFWWVVYAIRRNCLLIAGGRLATSKEGRCPWIQVLRFAKGIWQKFFIA